MRRRLEDFELTKISAVDRPAQQGAVVTILKRAPSTALTFAQALAKQKQQNSDPDDDGSIDDWSPKDQSRRRKPKRQPRGWSREDIDQVNKSSKVDHPFIEGARARAAATGVRLYEAIAAHRRANPRSWRHFYQSQQSQPSPQPMKKALPPDDAVVAWDQAVRSYVDLGLSKCEAMQRIRTQASSLFWKYRRSK